MFFSELHPFKKEKTAGVSAPKIDEKNKNAGVRSFYYIHYIGCSLAGRTTFLEFKRKNISTSIRSTLQVQQLVQ